MQALPKRSAMPRDQHMGDISREGDEARCSRGPASARPCRWRRRRPPTGPDPSRSRTPESRRRRLRGRRWRSRSWETSRGRTAPRRLTSRQSRAVEPPQAAIPAAVRALFSSSSSVDWTSDPARVGNTLPFTTTSQRSRFEDPSRSRAPKAYPGRLSVLSSRPGAQPCFLSRLLASVSPAGHHTTALDDGQESRAREAGLLLSSCASGRDPVGPSDARASSAAVARPRPTTCSFPGGKRKRAIGARHERRSVLMHPKGAALCSARPGSRPLATR